MSAYDAASPPRSATGNDDSGWRREPYARVPSPRHDDFPPAGGADEPGYGHSRRGRSPDEGMLGTTAPVLSVHSEKQLADLSCSSAPLQAIEEENEDALLHL